MKKRILLLLMLFSIALIKAQTVGELFTTADVIYEIVTLPTLTENGTANVNSTNKDYPNETLTIPVSVTDAATSTTYDVILIETDAFLNNTSIKYITINPTTLSITYRAFKNVDNLETVDMPNLTSGLLNGNQIFMLCQKLHTVNAPNYTSTMGNDTFQFCSLLTTFNIPGVTSVGNKVFLSCIALETISLPNLTSAGNDMFRSCSSLVTASLPILSSVGFQIFKNCTSLTTVNLNSLVTINYQGFFNCPSLVSIDLPLLTGTNNRCFEDCTSLKYVNLPSLVTLHQGTFDNTGLESIVFPATFTTFAGADTHFQNSTLLKHIGFASSTPIDLAGAHTKFTGIASNPVIIVPSGSAATYDAAAGWTDFSIVEGTLSKTATDITYSRNLGTENWYLISSPVNNEMYNDAYVTANSIDATGSVTENNAIAAYTTTGNTWDYMQDGEDLPFTPGVGYSVKRENAPSAGAGDISFTGTTLNSGDVTGVPVSILGDGFNLLGNPYLTNIDSGVFLTANANLAGQIDLFNQATGNYETHVTADNYVLAPGQGFFVTAESGTDVDFTTAIQTNVSTGVFQKTAISKIKLLINSGDTERFAKLYFTESATAGFDKGWDGERFTGVANKMDVFTQLVEGNTGKNYQVQSLSDANIEASVVSVGLISEAGKQITFSAETLDLPTNLKVFLEDRQTNTFTRLDEENSKYEVTLSENLNGVGRFFIHTSAKNVLSLDNSILESVSIYKLDNATLRIAGLSQGKVNVKLFNLLGEQMMHTSFEGNTSRDIALPNVAKGIYVVQLETENGSLNKKIILE